MSVVNRMSKYGEQTPTVINRGGGNVILGDESTEFPQTGTGS